MRRRDFVKGLVGSTAAWPLRAYAQQSATPIIRFLHSGIAEQTTQLDSFRMGLKESGFEDGRDVSVQYRFAEGRYDRLPALAAELVRQQVAVLFGGAVYIPQSRPNPPPPQFPSFFRSAAILCNSVWLQASTIPAAI
jgi:hypothetical protein